MTPGPAVEWRGVTFIYAGGSAPALVDVGLELGEAELVLVAGRTGSGKSTLLGTINALVPQFSGGRLDGDVRLLGASILGRPPRELADQVGYVGQDPLHGFVTETVEDELAYGMEQRGLGRQLMRRRVEETLDLLGIADLRGRPLRSLSGGQQQRVALGSVLTTHPRVLVLDEPTSALDPTAAEEVLGLLARLVHDLGVTVVLAEHRIERVLPFTDRLVLVDHGTVSIGEPAVMIVDSPVAPPLVELGRLAGWSPLPLTVRDARRQRDGLLGRLGAGPQPGPQTGTQTDPPNGSRAAAPGEVLLSAREVSVRYGSAWAVRDADLELSAGEVTAVMGRNGSGKSSLLWALQGSGPRESGSVRVAGEDPARVSAQRARALVGLVPQTASDLLYLETVASESETADRQSGSPPGTCAALLARLAPGVRPGVHPRDVSEGQRLALVLAIVLTSQPRVIALDEPTRGLDYAAKAALAVVLRGLADTGHAVVVASHDVEFVALVADHALVLAGGEVVSSGTADQVLAESPAFAPQVSKVLGPPWRTVDQVRAALS